MFKNIGIVIKDLIKIIVIGLIIYIFISIVSSTEDDYRRESQTQLENAIRKATVARYATEGIYPPSIQYLEDNYGIIINKKEFAVFYEVFSSNLMPEITVTKKWGKLRLTDE